MKKNMSVATGICNALFDLIINTGSVYLAILLLDQEMHIFGKTAMAIATACVAGSVIIYFACDMYSSTVLDKLHRKIVKLMCVQFFIISALLVSIVIVAPTRLEYYKLLFLSALLSTVALIVKNVLATKIAHAVRKSQRHRKTVLLVGSGSGAKEYKRQIEENPHYGYSVIGCVSDRQTDELVWLGSYKELKDVLEKETPDEVVIALSIKEEPLIQEFAAVCDDVGVRASIVPAIHKYFRAKCQVDMVGSLPVINTRNIPLDNPINAFMKRLMDILISVTMIVLTSPIMLVATIGVAVSSRGPVIFKQKRVGKNNKVFTMYKFRSMRVNEEEETAWTTANDTRKTRFGTFMRKTGIDELPQLFNVLAGQMSIVGPRPELPNFVEKYSKTVPMYKVKHQVKPGITGLAQIYGFRGDTSIEGRIEMDIKYIESWSLFSDIKIILSTPFKMFNRNEKFVK